jgi:exosortase A
VAVLLLLTVSIVAFYWSTFSWLVSEWSTTNSRFSHGFLLAAIALFLLVRSSRRLKLESISPCWWTLPLVFGASIAWLLGDTGSVLVVQTLALPVLALASVCTVLGRAAARQLSFAILYIVFALPVWEYVQFIFQDLTVTIVSFLLHHAGVPAIIEGKTVHIGSGSFRITSGCSGVMFLVVGLALAALYGHLYYRLAKSKWTLLAIAFGLSMVANWLRVLSIIIIGHVTDMQHSIVSDHHAFGWAVFSVFLVPLFVVARRLEHADGHGSLPEPARMPERTPGTVVVATIAVAAVLAVGPVWAAVLDAGRPDPADHQLRFPDTLNAWNGSILEASEWRPVFHGPAFESIAVYRSAHGQVCLYNAVYFDNEQGSELVFALNRVEGQFESIGNGEDSPAPAFDGSLQTRGLAAHDGYDRWQIRYWYEINGRRETNPAKVKLWQALATLRGRHASGIFAVAAKCGRDCEQADSQLREFLAASEGDLWLRNTLVPAVITQ